MLRNAANQNRIDSQRHFCIIDSVDADEKEICDFLRSWPGQFVSHREICKRAGGKWRYREDPKWALPILSRMAEKGILEADASGHFRLLPERKEKEKKEWLSPEVKKILERGKGADGVTEIDDPGEPEQ
jgi:hypothetical protein